MQNLGDSLYETIGPADLLNAVLVYERIGDHESVVFDGVRHIRVLAEIDFASTVTMSVYLKVRQAARYSRYCMRENLTGLSLRSFQVIDSHRVEVGVSELAEHCNILLNAERPIVDVGRDIVGQLTPVLLAEWDES